MSEESKMRKVTVTMELDVVERYETLAAVERKIRAGVQWHILSQTGLTITNINVTGEGFYHLVPDEPAEE